MTPFVYAIITALPDIIACIANIQTYDIPIQILNEFIRDEGIKKDNQCFTLRNLSIVPEYRHFETLQRRNRSVAVFSTICTYVQSSIILDSRDRRVY